MFLTYANIINCITFDPSAPLPTAKFIKIINYLLLRKKTTGRDDETNRGFRILFFNSSKILSMYLRCLILVWRFHSYSCIKVIMQGNSEVSMAENIASLSFVEQCNGTQHPHCRYFLSQYHSYSSFLTFFDRNLRCGSCNRFCRWSRLFTGRRKLSGTEFPAHRSRSGVGTTAGRPTTRCHTRTATHSRLQKQNKQILFNS